MIGASYASKISHEITLWNTRPGGLKRKIAKKASKKAIFGGFKVLAKSDGEELQNKKFSCILIKFKVFMLY